MESMLLLAMSETGKAFWVLKKYLKHLIERRKIQKFRRSNGWVDIDRDQRKVDDGYHRPERRAPRLVNWDLFLLPINEQLRGGLSLEAVLGYGQRAQEVAFKLKSVAHTDMSILFEGKTGTGKGLAALVLHELSERKNEPFIKVDCGAIPPTLIESELFGHERGSFTGAVATRTGRFQLAHRGTLFLDEISNMSLDMQTRLLGFLEERLVQSIGGAKSVRLDVRVISATNSDLRDLVRKHQFREDLFFRLSEFQIQMPPLVERLDDIIYLATKFLYLANNHLKKNVYGFSEKTFDFFMANDWGGNIRELKNCVRRAALVAQEMIEVEHLSECVPDREVLSLDVCLENAFVRGASLPEISELIRETAEKRIIERVYVQTQKNKRKTSTALGIDYSTLYRKMRDYAIR